jgi:hypothetical protein
VVQGEEEASITPMALIIVFVGKHISSSDDVVDVGKLSRPPKSADSSHLSPFVLFSSSSFPWGRYLKETAPDD